MEAVPDDPSMSTQEDMVAGVLSIMVECSCAVEDTQALCTLLQLNTATRKALQRCRGQQKITIKADEARAISFARWLPKHAGLVAELVIKHSSNWHPSNRETDYSTSDAFASAVLHAAGSPLSPTPSTAAGAPMQLLLRSLDSLVYVPPALLEGCRGLTRLELWSCCSWGAWCSADVVAAMQQLSNLKSLAMWPRKDCPYQDEDLYWSGYPCKAFCKLSQLTRLEMGPLVSADASNFPTTLVELKVEVVATVRMEEPPLPPTPPEDCTTSEDMLEYEQEWREDWLWQQWRTNMHVYDELQEAAMRLGLSHLPLLQRCELWHTPTQHELGAEVGVLDVQLASPHLTLLRLIEEFGDVVGLQGCCAHLHALTLSGCYTPTSRLVSLLPCMPELRSFELDGYEHIYHGGSYANIPIVKTTAQEERQLAASLGALTKLTLLTVDGLGPRGLQGDAWHLDAAAVAECSSNGARCGPWGEFLPNLKQLQSLVLLVDFPLSTADALQLTALTALTKLHFDSDWNLCSHRALTAEEAQALPVAVAQLKQHLTRLQVLNPRERYRCFDW